MDTKTISHSEWNGPELPPLDPAQPPDEELMAAIQMGDADALGVLVQRYRRLLKSVILRTVNDDAAAEDVLQECLLDVWRRADHYSAAKGRPLAWLMTLGRRRAIDHLRRSMAYTRACDRMEDEIKRTSSFTCDSSADCEQADIGRVLGQHISLLPDAQQEVIRLAFLQGMTQREVAHATHTPLGTVKTRLELGLKKLRQVFRTRSAMHTLQAA
ncbi:MAG: sigma-70 family RNA polymerase sigma factor [Prosthecobacter sp.]|jgi:RNA polymerase sigma-70 factor (ECF subfamily)|uniref:RNA polymerase sigma factor n=1 Tax=Prosthecobacter sp. TaxID=1965333 RepID=UPI0019FB7393|nr:sigma-70 family RNA polymerase sigma factor [Prosthecobacter sp.]MBE2281955.1 sigma-70 family RNA polymerase sigma factor [Prosthecobacter sp.]